MNLNDPAAQEQLLNLLKDGGRRVMYGGNAYEDDLEPAAPWESGESTAEAADVLLRAALPGTAERCS